MVSAAMCWLPLLGFRVPGTLARTGYVDIGQFRAVLIAVDDRTEPDSLAVLKSVDPAFDAVPSPLDPIRTFRYAVRGESKERFVVDVQVPMRGPTRDQPVHLPAPEGHTPPLRFLAFLLLQEIEALVLHGTGIPVKVPTPERFAVHKLLDVAQAHEFDRPHQGPEGVGAVRTPCAGVGERSPGRTPGGLGGSGQARAIPVRDSSPGAEGPAARHAGPPPFSRRPGQDPERCFPRIGTDKGIDGLRLKPPKPDVANTLDSWRSDDGPVRAMMRANLPSGAPHDPGRRPRQTGWRLVTSCGSTASYPGVDCAFLRRVLLQQIAGALPSCLGGPLERQEPACVDAVPGRKR